MIRQRHASFSALVDGQKRIVEEEKRRPMAAFFCDRSILLFDALYPGVELKQLFVNMLVSAVDVIEA